MRSTLSDVQLDHLILPVNDIDESIRFYMFDPSKHLIEIRHNG